MKNTPADSLLLNLRPLYTSEIVENRKLIFNTSTDSGWKRKPKSCLNTPESTDSLLLNFSSTEIHAKDSETRKTEAKAMGFQCVEVSGNTYQIDNLNNEDKVVILNFGFILRSVELFNECINLLEELLNKNVKKIIISSYVSPNQIHEFYENQAQKITDENEQKKITANLNRIKQLLLEFSVINCSLQPASIKKIEDDRFSTIIKNELEKDVFLASLKPLILKYYTSNNSVDEEDVILYIQKLASNYYEKIWSSCTTEEKILLFDLAEDSLVNIKNTDTYIPLRNLQEKGIVEVNDKYKVMNESFRNYILTNVETADLENTEIMKQRKSAWNSFRIPLILFASGIVIFLLATQQALVSNLYTLLIAVRAIAGVFIRISGMFSSKSKPPAEPKSN